MQGLHDVLLETQGRLGRCGGRHSGGCRWNGPCRLPLNLLPLNNTLHNTFGSPQILCIRSVFPQGVQHQLEIELQHRLGRRNRRDRRFFRLLKQLQRHKRPISLLLSCPGHQLLRKGLGQGAEGGQRQSLLREHCHIGFCHRNGIHQ